MLRPVLSARLTDNSVLLKLSPTLQDVQSLGEVDLLATPQPQDSGIYQSVVSS